MSPLRGKFIICTFLDFLKYSIIIKVREGFSYYTFSIFKKTTTPPKNLDLKNIKNIPEKN
jgi:hypothetical protein